MFKITAKPSQPRKLLRVTKNVSYDTIIIEIHRKLLIWGKKNDVSKTKTGGYVIFNYFETSHAKVQLYQVSLLEAIHSRS